MTGSTSIFHWPYPLPAEPFAAGAEVIGSLAKAIEAQMVVSTDSKSVSDPYDSYPLGQSLMMLTTAGSTNGGWPGPASGFLLSLRRSGGDATAQIFIKNTVSAPFAQLRVGNANGWSSWVTLGNTKLPDAVLTGQVSATPPTGGGVVAVPVTFPNGYFSGAPRVLVSVNNSTKPNECSASVSGISGGTSTDGCTVYIYRTGATATSVAWQAVHGVES